MDPIQLTLIVVFLLIFIATAVLTLASLPGWIEIPNEYRKKLFVALVLEVVSCIGLLFHEAWLSNQMDEVTPQSGWIAMKSNGELFRPKLRNRLLGDDIDTFLAHARKGVTLQIAAEPDLDDDNAPDFVVMNSFEQAAFGRMSNASLDASNLFNMVRAEGFARPTFKRTAKGTWEEMPEHLLPEEWNIVLHVSDRGYRITDKDPASGRVYADLHKLDATKPKLLFFHTRYLEDNEKRSCYYLVRLDQFDRRGDETTVSFLVFRLSSRVQPLLSQKNPKSPQLAGR
jgi:hypothetical protein